MTPTDITEKIKRAYDDGYESGRLGGNAACPYYYVVYDVLRDAWYRGRQNGEKDRPESEKERPHA